VVPKAAYTPPPGWLASRPIRVTAGCAVLALCYFAKLILIVLLLSLLVALILEPVVAWSHRIRIPRIMASLAAVALSAGGCLLLAIFVLGRATAFIEKLPSYSQEIRGAVSRLTAPAESLRRTTESVMSSHGERQPEVKVAQSPLQALLDQIGPVGEVILALGFIPFIAFFMLSWGEHVRTKTLLLFDPRHRESAEASLVQIGAMVRRFVVGNLLTGLVLGAVSTAVFGFLKLPFFYFVGFISGFVNLVPYLGAILALLPPLGVGLGHIGSSDAIVILVTVLVLHVIAANVIYPRLLGTKLRLNPLAGALALLVWGWLWGPIGLIFGIPITAGLKIVCDHVESLHAYGAWLGLPERQLSAR